MSTCCPNCSSPAAMGSDLASVCTECASVSLAGASFSLPALFAGVALAVGVGITVTMLRRWRAARPACA